MSQPKLIPELDVTYLKKSVDFYINILGFEVLYERPEERFAMLEREGVQIMLEEAAGPGRRFTTAKLEKPFGRGMNLQIEVSDADNLYNKILSANYKPLIPLEEKWYDVASEKAGSKQFVIADPDGYLLRFFQDLGASKVELMR